MSVSVTTSGDVPVGVGARVGAVDDERVEQALVTRCHMRRGRPADEPLHHPVERAADGEAADQRADGDDATLRASSAARMPGTARIGWMETNGLLGDKDE